MGQEPGRLQTVLPWRLRSPNLACTNEETPRGESPEATRPDSRGHTARVRTPYGEIPSDTHAHARTRTRTHGHARAPRRRGYWNDGGASHCAPAPGPGPCSNTGPAHSRNQISRTRPCSSHLTRSSSQSESFASVGWGPSTVPTLDSQVHRSESYSFTGSVTSLYGYSYLTRAVCCSHRDVFERRLILRD